jgi:alpha-glucosidase (family GH31 glycosyl hydrolase)
MVPAGINMGISGVPHWGGDIGGFHCNADGAEAADGELIARWIQQGSMGTNMMDQNACVAGATKASIWTAPEAMTAWATYGRLHTRLFPYLYSLAHDATATGAPIIRHMFLEHPDRADLRGVDDAYYLGPALLVAPVVARGERTKTVALPAGTYLDWRDEQLVAGGATVTLDAPLDKLPLLLRAGYLVPMLDPAIDTLADETNPDVVGHADVADVYDVVGLVDGAGAAGATLYDGDTFSAVADGEPTTAGLQEADEPELSTCDSCYLVTELAGGLRRVRVTTSATTVTAGGVTFTASSERRIRFDVYVAP